MQYNVNLYKRSFVSKAQALRFAHLIVILRERSDALHTLLSFWT